MLEKVVQKTYQNITNGAKKGADNYQESRKTKSINQCEKRGTGAGAPSLD